ncbi:MAG: type I secretion system permease/ATPase [Gemmatimonas sp.]
MAEPIGKRGPLGDALRHVRVAAWIIGIFSFAMNLLVLASPIYMMQVYDRVIPTGNGATLILLTLIICAALLVMASLDAIRSMMLTRIGAWLDSRLAKPVIEASVLRTIRQGNPFGALGLRDIATLRQLVGGPALVPLFDAPWAPIFLGIVFLIHPVLGWMSLVGAIVLAGLAYLNESRSRGALQESNRTSARAFAEADMTIRNADTIVAMGMLPGILHRWHDLNDESAAHLEKANDQMSWISSAAKFWRLLLQVGILGAGAWLVVHHEMTGGSMIAASIIMGRAVAPFEQAISVWKVLVAAQASYRRLAELLQIVTDDAPTTALPRPQGRIAAEQVTYGPPGAPEPTVQQVSFAVEPGETLAIIGPSGAGKTTLARLLVGSLVPFRGAVRLDGADVVAWDATDRGRYMGYLPQTVDLFAGTVRENIARFGEASDEDVIEAARVAGAHDLILSLPKGYDTPIGDGRWNLSGGQRQMIGLARAFFGKPSFIVLDEPNSNLDSAGEQALAAAIRAAKERKISVAVVTQRPNLLVLADKVLVMRNGRVELLGPRDEVLAKMGWNVGGQPAPIRGPRPLASVQVAQDSL